MNVSEFLKQNIVFLDGGTGTILQAQGLQPGERPERWNLSHPDRIAALHRAYYDAGSNVVATNTFGANRLHFSAGELARIIPAAVENAKTARQESTAPQEKFIALDVGPSGKLLKPLGDLDFEDAVALFAETVRLGVRAGVDLILIETMGDSYETKAALLAAKENCDLPVFVSNAYGADGKLMTGADAAAMVALLEGMGADAIGVNCSLGPEQLAPVVREYLQYASVPVLLKPNAGLPREEGGKTLFDVSAAEFARLTAQLVREGVRVAGGCCGTTPEYIAALRNELAGEKPVPLTEKNRTVVSSYTHAVTFGERPVLIGERINPTGKKRFKQALLDGDIDYILNEGVRQQDAGAHILDVNVGLPDIDEPAMLERAACELQAVLDLPLQLDTAHPDAMARALRRYNGKALINSVSGKKESMAAIFPLLKKYGGVAIALTLDDHGIPETAEGRLRIAENILRTAAEYGVAEKDIIFDTLAMTVSAEPNAARVTLDALRRIREELGANTSLGVSNVSFGLPSRDCLNAAFFTSALENGLSAAIVNPFSAEIMKAYYAFRALHGMDENCLDYIAFSAQLTDAPAQPADTEQTLQSAIRRELKEQAARLAKARLETEEPLSLVQTDVIPALDAVGREFEAGRLYLPQLLMSAEAAKAAFEEIKARIPARGAGDRSEFVLATVHGDIHDIGKNIVKLLLENYGFRVLDLGKDVPEEKIAETAAERRAPMVGLSALMTTTVPAMARTIALLRERAPWCKVVVGGAVLTQDYADRIGADHYAPDAMDAVRWAEETEKQ